MGMWLNNQIITWNDAAHSGYEKHLEPIMIEFVYVYMQTKYV